MYGAFYEVALCATWRFLGGAFWASLRGACAEDQQYWDKIFGKKNDDGTSAIDPVSFDEAEAVLKMTEWWRNYTNQVVGGAKVQCKLDAQHRCIIFCVNSTTSTGTSSTYTTLSSRGDAGVHDPPFRTGYGISHGFLIFVLNF
jgi:hypothetical protein